MAGAIFVPGSIGVQLCSEGFKDSWVCPTNHGLGIKCGGYQLKKHNYLTTFSINSMLATFCCLDGKKL